MREAFIFVVDGRRLEAMSVLLTSSLVDHHPDRGAAAIIAYVTTRSLPDLSPATLRFYDHCGVEVRLLPDAEDLWARPYPHGNKILACADPRDVERTTFLDTDTVCCGKLTGLEPAGSEVFCAVPEGRLTWGKEVAHWQAAYRHFGLDLPEERVTLSRRRTDSLPYFNAGYLNFPERITSGGAVQGFGGLWLDTAIELDHVAVVPETRPWLDQITLPLTLYRHGVPFRALSDLYNFSISDRQRMKRADKCNLIHYHRARYLRTLPALDGILARLQARTPAAAQAGIAALVSELLAPDETPESVVDAAPAA